MATRFPDWSNCAFNRSWTTVTNSIYTPTAFPAPIRQVLTDNGSEFAGAFDDFAQQQGWQHCYTYPQCPKMNAYNERFNRTVQEEFVAFEQDLLADDIRAFNHQLLAYLGRYNSERSHHSLNYLTPCQTLAKCLPQEV